MRRYGNLIHESVEGQGSDVKLRFIVKLPNETTLREVGRCGNKSVTEHCISSVLQEIVWLYSPKVHVLKVGPVCGDVKVDNSSFEEAELSGIK